MNYTSIEQSKQLLELGLNPDSADMCYLQQVPDSVYFLRPAIKGVDTEQYYASSIPCWSVSALLELMPKSIGCYDLTLIASNKEPWYLSYKDFENIDVYKQSSMSLINVVYNMTCYLLKNNLINNANG